jgi:hypothetical protein
VQQSVQSLASDGAAIFARQLRLAAPLLGAGRPIEEQSYVGAFGSLITGSGGIFGRATMGRVSVLAGISYAEDRDGRAEIRDATTFAGALRYVHPANGSVHPFAEIGGWITPDATLTLSRSYVNGAGTALGRGTTEGEIGYHYVRLGAAVQLGQGSELSLSGELGRSRLDLAGYVEPLSASNPFEATVEARRERMTVVRLQGQFSHRFGPRVTATFYAGPVWARYGDGSGLVLATVPGIGPLVAAPGNPAWIEGGARIGYDLGRFSIELFGDFGNGESGVGEGAHAGLALRLRL